MSDAIQAELNQMIDRQRLIDRIEHLRLVHGEAWLEEHITVRVTVTRAGEHKAA